ncbi:hypothetical protein ACN47E_005891 [Coniothyrium glycines]
MAADCTTSDRSVQGTEYNKNIFPPIPKAASTNSGVSTPGTSVSSKDEHIDCATLLQFIALGCLHLNHSCINIDGPRLEEDWIELILPELPQEIKVLVGNHASQLLKAQWIRMFLHQPRIRRKTSHNLARIYLMREDWGRRSIDRNSKKLKGILHQLLQQIDVSQRHWKGDPTESEIIPFDSWATAEPVSLYYLFNKLPSPTPDPQSIRNRYARAAAHDLLRSATYTEWEDHGEQPLAGLRTRLYPYQARSATLMIQREASPPLQLDPRLEIRTSPEGDQFFYAPRDGSFLQEPVFYEVNRGGILAESMGLGKTLISLAVILATKGHLPQIPSAYQSPAFIRSRVGKLSDMAAGILGRRSIPARAYIEQSEANDAGDLSRMRAALDRNIPYYEIPSEVLRVNRTTKIPPARQLVVCSGTIIVVPRNLLHQWQSEIRKHVLNGGLKILVVDNLSKRGRQSQVPKVNDDTMEFASELPPPTELMKFDVVLFTRNRFELEIQDGQDDQGRRAIAGITRVCNCPYIGATRLSDCNCLNGDKIYISPLKKLHWLRIVIDEGHSFSSATSNAVLVAKQIQAERRWIVSGTPAKNLVGVEVDISTMDPDGGDATILRNSAIEQRKTFTLDKENSKAVKALGSLASNFLMVRPWCDSGAEGRLEWDDYVYRHESPNKKTYSAFSSCFLRTLEGLVVKTRPEDVEKDIILPPMRHRTVYLKPCWFDKMTANMFIQVLRANAVTSERTDVDYLFHKNSLKARHSLIRNLRQSNFTWTGFSLEDVVSTLETSSKYLLKEDKNCSLEDAQALLESSQSVNSLTTSEAWIALSKAHEVGMAINKWPRESAEAFALAKSSDPILIGITQVIDGQVHVDSNMSAQDPAAGLIDVSRAAKANAVALAEAGRDTTENKVALDTDETSQSTSVSLTRLENHSPHRASIQIARFPQKADEADLSRSPQGLAPTSPLRQKKRKLTLTDETITLDETSSLRETEVVGTTSAKLTYLLDKIMQHQATDKILVFYDGDNAAFYLAQCLEMLYINHRIYARTLDNVKRSEYVRLFNEDPDVRVLLIDVACGALGLNLNAASIVLIVNPINRPFLEAQAVKRAHRIGQTKQVLVETLVLEDTMEHAIFNHAKKMSHSDHQEAKELEDDVGIIDIIQNAKILPVDPQEGDGIASYALLKTTQPIFGRPNSHKYHRYGHTDARGSERPAKKAKPRNPSSRPKASTKKIIADTLPSTPDVSIATAPNEQVFSQDAQHNVLSSSTTYSSIFGES